MKYFLFICAFLFFLLAGAQNEKTIKLTLEWNTKQLIHTNKHHTWYMPTVRNNTVDFEKKLPSFFYKWEVPYNSEIADYTITQINYRNISERELYDVEKKNIPGEFNSNLTIISNRNKSEARLEFIPLLSENNQYKKIVSVVINYSLRQKPVSNRRLRYTQNSVLSQGDWYKFSVDTTGVYKLSRSFLQNLGMSFDGVNPQNIAIYGNGGQLLPYKIGDFRYDDLEENAIYFEGEADGRFDSNDYILFYAKGPDDWVYNYNNGSIAHRKNIYSDKAYYFVHIKQSPAKRMQVAPEINTVAVTTYTNFDNYIVHEIDRNNLFEAGQQWFGERFDIQNERTIHMRFDQIDVTYPLQVKTRVAASSSVATTLAVKLNNQDLYTLSIPLSSGSNLAQATIGTANSTVTTGDLAIDFSYNNGSDPSSECYLDYIEVIGKSTLTVSDKQFSFRNFDVLNTMSPVAFSLQNPGNIKAVWDVTDYTNAKIINNQSTGSEFSFKANGGELHEYIVVNSQDYFTPKKVGKVKNQNLHALQNVDYVIITKDFLVDEAEVLANYHREHSNLNVKVVPLYQIYNEFGSGAEDITAIRDFTKFLYDNSQPHLRYILLFGDASFDFKGIRYERGIVPAFQSYKSFNMAISFVTDDFYAIVSDDNEGDLDSNSNVSQDVAISRIPVNTIDEARSLVAKLLNYYNEDSFGDWRNQMILIADDIDKTSDEILQIDQEILADDIKSNKPLINIKKIYSDAFYQVISAGGSRYPSVNTAIGNSMERGVLIADYFGHGGEDGLALERILETSEIQAWHNFNTLPLFIVVSCEFARFDNPLRPNTAGELVMRNPDGGAGHHIATAREITIQTGNYINQHLMPFLLEFNGENNSISENLRLVKNQLITSSRFFVFSLGDPAMRLAIPKPDIKITQMNGVPISQSIDTISALSHVYFDGVVTHPNGTTDTGFNGELSVTIYDKPSDKATLTNDGIGSVMVFDTQESKIFRGSATVTNGTFSFDFVAPRDIRIAYGKGKISLYADNDIIDKGGYNLDVIVGGINEDAPEDNQGPRLKLYMNDESFLDGGTTNQSPLFLAFFEDENGINTSLTSVDHDIVAILDGDQVNQIILNEYYTTELDDFTKGSLAYRLRNLAVGPHTIQLKAYDTYNNPGEATLNFVVLDDGKLVLEHVLNYPNPFVNYTEFWFNHNKPNEPLEVQIQIFTISGKLVKTINQMVQTTGGLSREIHWDGLDDFGQRIGKGVYIYQLQVKSSISGLKAKKYEKLVILQ